MQLRNLLWVSLLLACRSGGGAGPGASAETSADAPNIPFEKYTLDNGLTVVLHEDHRLPLVAVSVWYDVGALDERPGRTGFAHLFEHMMFQGSAHVPEDQHFQILQSVGATQVNGTTSFDRTNYFETVPSGALETALWLESDRMGFLLEAVTQRSLDNQISVVQNERRQSVENRPYGLMEEQLIQTLFPAPHPYSGNVIGSLEDIQAATLEDVKAFFRTYYTPANATLTLAGDFEPDAAKALVEKYFGPLEGQPAPPEPDVGFEPLERELVVRFPEPVGRLPKITVAWLLPGAFFEGSAALDLLAHVISGTRSSRLDRQVSHEDPLAASVSASFREHAAGSIFRIDLVVRPGRTVQEARAAIDGVLDDLRTRPPTEAERKRALFDWEVRVFRQLERLGGFGGRAEQLQSYHHYLGDPGKLPWDVARHRSVTREDLAEAMERLDDRRVVMLAQPLGGQAAGAPGAEARP